jgi:hypothetical protein
VAEALSLGASVPAALYAGAMDDHPATDARPGLEPLHVDTVRVVLVGTGFWLLALVITLVVPGLHSGARSWWPWAAVAGAVLGGLGLAYLRRGRGNAAAQ